jgi:hypothetical protein
LSKNITKELQVYRVFRIFPYLIPTQKNLFSHDIITLKCEATWEGHAKSPSSPVLTLNSPKLLLCGPRNEDVTTGTFLPSCLLLELGLKQFSQRKY